jgi:hypothetical protein
MFVQINDHNWINLHQVAQITTNPNADDGEPLYLIRFAGEGIHPISERERDLIVEMLDSNSLILRPEEDESE